MRISDWSSDVCSSDLVSIGIIKATVLVLKDKAANACRIEPFGPVALMMPIETADEAVAEANDLPFGLAAYAFTNSKKLAYRFANEIQSGVVCINELQESLTETPFGGYKESGMGSEGGVEGLREFMRVKCVRQGGRSEEHTSELQ